MLAAARAAADSNRMSSGSKVPAIRPASWATSRRLPRAAAIAADKIAGRRRVPRMNASAAVSAYAQRISLPKLRSMRRRTAGRISGSVGVSAGLADSMVGIVVICSTRLASRRDSSRSGRSQR